MFYVATAEVKLPLDAQLCDARMRLDLARKLVVGACTKYAANRTDENFNEMLALLACELSQKQAFDQIAVAVVSTYA